MKEYNMHDIKQYKLTFEIDKITGIYAEEEVLYAILEHVPTEERYYKALISSNQHEDFNDRLVEIIEFYKDEKNIDNAFLMAKSLYNENKSKFEMAENKILVSLLKFNFKF